MESRELLEAARRALTPRDHLHKGGPVSGCVLADAFAFMLEQDTPARWILVGRELWEQYQDPNLLGPILEEMPEGTLWGAELVLVDEPYFVVMSEDASCRAFVGC